MFMTVVNPDEDIDHPAGLNGRFSNSFFAGLAPRRNAGPYDQYHFLNDFYHSEAGDLYIV